MSQPDPKSLEETIRAATQRLSRAEAELSASLEELPLSDRADKRMVTQRLQLAFHEILAAKTALSDLIAPPDDPAEDRPE